MSFMLNKIEKSKGGGYEPLATGKYDATLHAIVSLERQKYDFKGQAKVAPKALLIFEVPSVERPSGDDLLLPALMSYEVTVSTSEKGNFIKVVEALTRSSLTEDDLFTFVNNEGDMNSLLGKACVLEVVAKKNQNGDLRNYVDGVAELDKRLPQPVAVREPFIFRPGSPDLDIFKNKLISWTRDKIMAAVNSDEFPKELHKSYRDIKEQEAAKSNNKLT